MLDFFLFCTLIYDRFIICNQFRSTVFKSRFDSSGTMCDSSSPTKSRKDMKVRFFSTAVFFIAHFGRLCVHNLIVFFYNYKLILIILLSCARKICAHILTLLREAAFILVVRPLRPYPSSQV